MVDADHGPADPSDVVSRRLRPLFVPGLARIRSRIGSWSRWCALVGRRIRLGNPRGLGWVALVGRRIRRVGFVRSDHHRLLYRKAGSPNPLVRVGEPSRELVLDAFQLLLE